MKTLVTKIWVVIMSIVAISLTSCDKDNVFGDDEDWLTPKENTNPEPEPTPTDSIPETKIDWSAQMERSFGYNRQTGNWPSTIVVHYTDGVDSTFVANCPMTTRIEAPAEILVDPETPATTFIGLDTQVSLDSTEWVKSIEDGRYYRTITRQQVIHMSSYDAIIISTHVEAKMIREGKEIFFLHGNEPAPTKKEASTSQGEDVTREDKTYSVEISHIVMDHKLHPSYPTTAESRTNVLREKTVPAEEKTEDPSMPTPDLKVKRIINIPNYSYSPEWLGLPTNDRVKAWHKVLPVLAEDEDGIQRYHIWVDGTYVCSVEKGSEKFIFDSAYLAEGSWRPAKLSSDSSGWRYDFIVNGEGKFKTIYGSLSLIEDLKNFAKAHNAGQTPQILTEKTSTSYNGHQYVVVKGYSIGMEALISTTIGEVF